MKKILLLSLIFFNLCLVQAKPHFYIKVYNGIYTGSDGHIAYYTISSGDSLKVKAMAVYQGNIDSTSFTADWYLDNVFQFNAGGMVTFQQPGLITFGGIGYPENSIQLSVVTGINDLTSATLPFPFSQSSSINTNNLRYKIVNALGQIIEQGKFSGEIILRNNNSTHQLQPGIYFVIYSDADDNRQVLTDKVFVSNQ